MKPTDILKLLSCIIVCELVGVAGGFFTLASVSSWYTTLAKPAWTPPNWAFAPIWTTLYALMGISLYFIINSKKEKWVLPVIWRPVYLWFFGQLALNVAWSIVFFGKQSVGGGFFVILCLMCTSLVTLYYAFKTSKIAGFLLTPYIAWITIATYLNWTILLLN
ncbi:MAG: TspO/MBR family protein [Candidatus Bathyarchaeia archaeon]|jgi:tryptophan-rich sensory protein